MGSKRSKLKLVFVKPSKYDDEGYVIRYWRGVLPNNTLSVLCGLTDEVLQKKQLPNVDIEYEAFDEMVSTLPVHRIVKWNKKTSGGVLICLVGVQTNQFPRAYDLAMQFRRHGLQVIIGGFHVSGTVNVLGEDEPEIRALREAGISYFVGEVEERWTEVLRDASDRALKEVYYAAKDLKKLPCLHSAPLPVVSEHYMKKFAYTSFGTLDTSRGCPFGCSFCTVINVQGRKLRERSVESITDFIRKNFRKNGVDFYFFTDDNFSRKKLWRETFLSLIALREEENIPVTFMMQVDLARKPDEFVSLAAKAGCTQVFLGMESVNPDNLSAEGKKQNCTEEYANIINSWRNVGIAVHAAYIIGFPFDTAQQVKKDIEYLRDEVRPDQASFFMLTPLPGSMDHLHLRKEGRYIDPDLNKRDSFHATIEHSHMTEKEWCESYEKAWNIFYDKENLISILKRWNHIPKTYWGLLSIFFWYKNSFAIEGEHPMISGFFRLKNRTIRRPGYSVDSRARHSIKRIREVGSLCIAWGKLFLEMKEVWWRSRKRSAYEERYIKSMEKFHCLLWSKFNLSVWQDGYLRLKEDLPVQAQSVFQTFYSKSQQVLKSPAEMEQFYRLWLRVLTAMKQVKLREEGKNTEVALWIERYCSQTVGYFSYGKYMNRLRLIHRFGRKRMAVPQCLQFDSSTSSIHIHENDVKPLLFSPVHLMKKIWGEFTGSIQFAFQMKANLLP